MNNIPVKLLVLNLVFYQTESDIPIQNLFNTRLGMSH